MNIFERASKQRIRFETSKGRLTCEDLWDLPLKTRTKSVDLNALAQYYNKLIKEDTEVDFVDTEKKDPEYTTNKLKFEIILHIIKSKKETADKAAKAMEIKEEKELLLRLIEEKENETLKSLSLDELKKRVKTLES